MTRTRRPRLANAAPRFSVDVVFATPPFCIARASTRPLIVTSPIALPRRQSYASNYAVSLALLGCVQLRFYHGAHVYALWLSPLVVSRPRSSGNRNLGGVALRARLCVHSALAARLCFQLVTGPAGSHACGGGKTMLPTRQDYGLSDTHHTPYSLPYNAGTRVHTSSIVRYRTHALVRTCVPAQSL